MTVSGKFRTSGSWSLSDAGVLTLSGTVDDSFFGKSILYDYRDKIKSVVCASGTVIASFSNLFDLTGDSMWTTDAISATSIDLSNAKISTTDWSSAFFTCKNLSVLKLPSASGVASLKNAFYGCKSLASLDLSMVSTVAGCDCYQMFTYCDSLARVVFGSSFNVDDSEDWVDTGFGPAKNLTTGLSIAPKYDSGGIDPFTRLTAAERKGTWDRSVEFSYSAKAERDPLKPTVTISVTFATNSESSTRSITVYRKKVSDDSYPSTAFGTIACSGNSGTFSSTFSCDDQAYDFKVVFDDGEGEYVAYPVVDENMPLMELTKDGALNLTGGSVACYRVLYSVSSASGHAGQAATLSESYKGFSFIDVYAAKVSGSMWHVGSTRVDVSALALNPNDLGFAITTKQTAQDKVTEQVITSTFAFSDNTHIIVGSPNYINIGGGQEVDSTKWTILKVVGWR